MDKISKREQKFKEEVKKVAREYNEEVRIKMTSELQEKIMQRKEIEEVDIEADLPSTIIWTDRRKEEEKKQYENSHIGELEQMIDETKDSATRRELIEKLRLAKMEEKNRKIAELDSDIGTREDEVHQTEKDYLSKCARLREEVEKEIISEIEPKKEALKKAQEAKKQYVSDLVQAQKIRREVRKNSKIYKAANDEAKSNIQNMRKEYKNIKTLESEIKSLEEELKEFKEKYGNIDLENEISGINALVAKTMGLKEDQEVYNSIMDLEEKTETTTVVDPEEQTQSPVTSKQDQAKQPSVVIDQAAAVKKQEQVVQKPAETRQDKPKQLPAVIMQKEEQKTNNENKIDYSILIGRNAKLKIGKHEYNISSKTVKEGINLKYSETIKLLTKYVDIDPDGAEILNKKISEGAIDTVVLNIIDKASISEEQKILIANDYAKNVLEPNEEQKSNDKRHIQYDLVDLSRTSFINRFLGREINSEEKLELAKIARIAEKLNVAKTRGTYQPDWKSKLLGKVFGKEVKALPPSQRESNIKTHKQYTETLSPDKFEQQVEKQEPEELKGIEVPKLDISNIENDR